MLEDEELYKTAVDIVLVDKKATVSHIQRKLRIGYNRASEIIDRMEKEGIISSADAVGRRDIFKDSSKLPQNVQSAIDENPHLGKYIRQEYEKQQKKEEKEPVLSVVKEADEKNNVGGIAVDRLRSLIERVERLEGEKSAIGSDIRDIFAEAKSAGFDVKTMKSIIKLRKMEASDRDEAEFLLETYCKALDL